MNLRLVMKPFELEHTSNQLLALDDFIDVFLVNEEWTPPVRPLPSREPPSGDLLDLNDLPDVRKEVKSPLTSV